MSNASDMIFRHDDDAQSAMAIASPQKKLPPQVLVVDDSREIREFVSLLLRLSGYRVIQATDGAAAQTVLKTEHPDLVISDLEMPVCNGWEMLTYCHTWHPGLPVLIVSSALGRQPEVEGWASGYLPKPFDLVQFHDEVERLIYHAA